MKWMHRLGELRHEHHGPGRQALAHVEALRAIAEELEKHNALLEQIVHIAIAYFPIEELEDEEHGSVFRIPRGATPREKPYDEPDRDAFSADDNQKVLWRGEPNLK